MIFQWSFKLQTFLVSFLLNTNDVLMEFRTPGMYFQSREKLPLRYGGKKNHTEL